MNALRKISPVFLAILFCWGILSAASSQTSGAKRPDWYVPGHRVSFSGDVVARLLGGGTTSLSPSNQGSICTAEASTTGNVQVNCLAEDGGSAQNTQSETSVSASGDKVVVGFNDTLVCCTPALNLSGYSVSTDGGTTFTDMGDLPWQPTVQPIGDPSVAHDDAGNFYFASLARVRMGWARTR